MSVLFLIVFIDLVGFGLVIPLLPFYAARFGASPEQVTILLTVYYVGVRLALMQGGGIGPLTRRFGEERRLLGGLGLIALGLLVLPGATGIVQLGVSMSLLAFGMGAMQPSLNSLISRRAGADQQGEVLGVAQSVSALSRVIGPAIAGVLFAGIGPGSPFRWGAVLVVLAFVIGLGVPRLSAESGA